MHIRRETRNPSRVEQEGHLADRKWHDWSPVLLLSNDSSDLTAKTLGILA